MPEKEGYKRTGDASPSALSTGHAENTDTQLIMDK